MTREVLIGLGWLILLSGALALALDAFMLRQAWISRRDALSEPLNSPERIVADSEVLDDSGRVVLALLITALGAIWLLSVIGAPSGDQDVSVGPIAIALVAVLVGMSVLSVLQSVRGLLYWRRLRESLITRREACAYTTFEGCPYISPERLLEVRYKALQLAEAVEPLTHHGEEGLSDDS